MIYRNAASYNSPLTQFALPLFCLLVFFCCGVTAWCGSDVTIRWRIAQENAIRVVAFRSDIQYLQRANEKETQPQWKIHVIFLGIYHLRDIWTDPNPAVMTQFRSIVPTVKPHSDDVDKNRVPTDKQTGQIGVISYLDEIRWINNSEVEVEGGIGTGRGPGGVAWRYHIVYRHGNWIIEHKGQSVFG